MKRKVLERRIVVFSLSNKRIDANHENACPEMVLISMKSRWKGNDQELIRSHSTSHPQIKPLCLHIGTFIVTSHHSCTESILLSVLAHAALLWFFSGSSDMVPKWFCCGCSVLHVMSVCIWSVAIW